MTSRAALTAEYIATVGYDPFADDPTITEATVAQTLAEIAAERARAAAMNAMQMISAALAQPDTHKVVMKLDDGTTQFRTVRSIAVANTYSVGKRIINRATGTEAHIVSVEVSEI